MQYVWGFWKGDRLESTFSDFFFKWSRSKDACKVKKKYRKMLILACLQGIYVTAEPLAHSFVIVRFFKYFLNIVNCRYHYFHV